MLLTLLNYHGISHFIMCVCVCVNGVEGGGLLIVKQREYVPKDLSLTDVRMIA